MSFLINPYAFLAAGGDFEPIATVTVGSGGASSIEFVGIPSTFQHLQIRMIGKLSSTQQGVFVQFNNSTSATSYATHLLYGTGSSAFGAARVNIDPGIDCGLPWNSTDQFAGVVDILDYSSTSKNTTVRSLTGTDANGGGIVGVLSGLWLSQSAVSSLKLFDAITGGTFAQHTAAALYGIKA